jgi:hypothetical protein
MLFRSTNEQVNRKAELMKRLTVSDGCIEMASADGGKQSGVESNDEIEDFGMRGGRRAADHRYNMLKPPSLSPPPFTDLPDKKMAKHVGGKVYAIASWWNTDTEDSRQE